MVVFTDHHRGRTRRHPQTRTFTPGIRKVAKYMLDERECIDYMRRKGLLKRDFHCYGDVCSKVMNGSLSDKEIFQCTHCHRHYSIRQGSSWSCSKLPLKLLLSLLYFFFKGDSVKQTLDHLDGEVSKTFIIQWFSYFRDVCTTWINNTRLQFNG